MEVDTCSNNDTACQTIILYDYLYFELDVTPLRTPFRTTLRTLLRTPLQTLSRTPFPNSFGEVSGARRNGTRH